MSEFDLEGENFNQITFLRAEQNEIVRLLTKSNHQIRLGLELILVVNILTLGLLVFLCLKS